MGQPIVITNSDYSAADLCQLASRGKDGQVVRRLLALALIPEGHSRTEAAQMPGMERQALRDWVRRNNAEGVPGLILLVGMGPLRRLTEAQVAELRDLVVAGPDSAVDNVVRWRCVDLREKVRSGFRFAWS